MSYEYENGFISINPFLPHNLYKPRYHYMSENALSKTFYQRFISEKFLFQITISPGINDWSLSTEMCKLYFTENDSI